MLVTGKTDRALMKEVLNEFFGEDVRGMDLESLFPYQENLVATYNEISLCKGLD